MAGNKKPRKKRPPVHQRRIAHVPMMGETHQRIAMQLQAAIFTLTTAPSVESYNALAKLLQAITFTLEYLRKGGNESLVKARDTLANSLRTAVLVMDAITRREDRIHTWAVTDDEAASLRASAGALDTALGMMPANVLDAAMNIAEAEAAAQDRAHRAKQLQEQGEQ